MDSSVPMVRTFAREGAATACECSNRDTSRPSRTRPTEMHVAGRNRNLSPVEVLTIMQPVSSMVSKMPETTVWPVWTDTGCPSPAASASQRRRISPNPLPPSQMPRHSAQLSERPRKSCSALVSTPSAASDVAGVGVPSGAATMLVPMPTTTARLPPGRVSASSRIPESFACPARTSLGHFRENPTEAEPGHGPKRRLQRQTRSKAERRRHGRRNVDGFKNAAGQITPRRDPRPLPPPPARGLFCRDKPHRPALARRAPAPWLPNSSSRSDRSFRADSRPMWLVDRA